MTGQSLLLRFSYFEHDWDEDIEGVEAMEAELLRRAAEGEWHEVVDDEPDEFDTLDDLVQRAEEVVVGEWEMPVEAVRQPLDKLRAIIADGGWTFATGEFSDFEGHHNDTELLVKLVR
ncbi:hypothetical protein [Catellatospora chokoriensis]|uniref:Uncharacterized protein n=1 Tax=Catellatospora chokoriensis TaxID=310353 RepID=A0A8J3NTG6_9ACTN|nr:hypothetical protein [Catellatospora chokoriensis]GIF91706.1 hypothetical protein Cch02nite_51500 [Catellatospora chokoriensis]